MSSDIKKVAYDNGKTKALIISWMCFGFAAGVAVGTGVSYSSIRSSFEKEQKRKVREDSLKNTIDYQQALKEYKKLSDEQKTLLQRERGN